jgi:hypothetical protein
MRPTKLALSALALAFALSGTAYAMDSSTSTPAQPAANAAVHKAAAPAKHRLFKRTAKKAPTQTKAPASTSTTKSGTN